MTGARPGRARYAATKKLSNRAVDAPLPTVSRSREQAKAQRIANVGFGDCANLRTVITSPVSKPMSALVMCSMS